jgi:hypothetical protein
MKVKYYTDIKNNLHFLVFDTFNKAYKWGLHPNDIKILAEFYNLDYFLVKQVPTYQDRMTILFSKDSKDAIYKKLNMSYNTFNNSLVRLRKKGLLGRNEIIEKYLLDLGKDEFNIVLNVVDEGRSGETVGQT